MHPISSACQYRVAALINDSSCIISVGIIEEAITIDPNNAWETLRYVALKFADLSNFRGTSYVFDLDRFTAFEGKTGPYLLYQAVRIKSLLRRAEEQGAILTDRAAWLGQTASRALTTGQALRQGMLRPAQVFQAGATVKIVAQGPGFQISSEAQALSAGVVGQQARVKMDNGRVTSGTVLDVRTVKIDL